MWYQNSLLEVRIVDGRKDGIVGNLMTAGRYRQKLTRSARLSQVTLLT